MNAKIIIAATAVAAASIGGLTACGSTHAVTPNQAAAAASAAAKAGAAKQAASDKASASASASTAAVKASKAAAAKAAADKAAASKKAAAAPPAPAAPAPAPAPATNCGSGVSAGPNTSCSFALNVEQAWASSGNGNVAAYSPVTGGTYTMSCAGSSPVVCTGGNNASVYISASSAAPPQDNWQQSTVNNVVEPSTVGFSGDAGNIFVVSGGWSSWGSASTTASGTVNYQGCVPNCAQGSETPYPATVTFSGLSGGQYTSVTETIQDGPDAGTTTSAVTGTWPNVS